jgi:hypothetical protein
MNWALVRFRRPYHEAVGRKAKAAVGMCTFGTWHSNQRLQQTVTPVTSLACASAAPDAPAAEARC